MPAYVVVNVEVRDPAEYEHYERLAPAAIAAYGGRYLARVAGWRSSKALGSPGGWSSWSSRP